MPEESATQRVAEVLAERVAIQANLLELNRSFVKRMLDGAALTGQTRERWAAAAALGKHDELRAYKAKAVRVLGAAEDPDLVTWYDQAYSLLWIAPCDLAAAEAAVAAYQRAILATEGRR